LYLIDTDVVSEARKKGRANPGVLAFFERVGASDESTYLSAVSVGELRRGVELVRRRGDIEQAGLLEAWLTVVLEQYEDKILAFDSDAAQVWGRSRVPDPGHPLDKQIAAIALVNDLILVTRNTSDFMGLGVKLSNPFFSVTYSK
jgi:predicted nucleic acid-binding protein